jgi:hypothetical protein
VPGFKIEVRRVAESDEVPQADERIVEERPAHEGNGQI